MCSFVYYMDMEWWHVGIYILRGMKRQHCSTVAVLIFSLIYLAAIGWWNPEIYIYINTHAYRPGDGIIAWITYCLSMCVRACVHVLLSNALYFATFSQRTSFFFSASINAIFHSVVCVYACLLVNRTQNARRFSGNSVHSSNSFSLDKVPNILTS